MRISSRLLLSFGLAVFFIILVGGYGAWQMSQLAELTAKMYKHPLAVSNAVRNVNIDVVKMHRYMKDIALAQNKAQLNHAAELVNQHEVFVYKDFDTIKVRFLGDQKDVDNLIATFTAWKTIRDEVIALMQAGKKAEAAAITKGKGAKHVQLLEKQMQVLTNFARNKADEFMQNAEKQEKVAYQWLFGVVMLVAIISLWMAVSTVSLINYSLKQAIGFANAIAMGDLNNRINITRKDEIGQLFHALDSMQTQLCERIEEDKRIANEALRINQALDSVKTPVLITDDHYQIIYTNQAAQTLFQQHEADFQLELPNFAAMRMTTGHSIDTLYTNPQLQRSMLDNLHGSQRARLNLNTLHIDYYVSEVINSNGERIGIVKEFNDRTVEVVMEQEINGVIHAASQGDFQQRIDLEGKAGFFLAFSESLNQILDYNQQAVTDTMRVFAALAQGDLTQKITNNYSGAFEQLKNDANATVTKLTEVVETIKQTASTVNMSADEIAKGNISLSQRTEEQAASLQQTAASMEEMTGTVQQNADSARQATKLAAIARERAEQGGVVVNNTIEAMVAIDTSSKQVADIISVINDIAFQTNLLALNAAVEAARAGEQGRGFAVVATEVRNLAQRSGAAAKEIKDLIRDSMEKVNEGMKLVKQSGEALEDIVSAGQKVNDIVAEIAAASQEQTSGIHQVNKAISQMDEMTQQNAALVEEAASASTSMSAQAQSLLERVAFFSTGTLKSLLPSSVDTQVEPKLTFKALPKPHLVTYDSDDGWEDF